MLSRRRRWLWFWLAVGALLRGALVYFPRPLDDDTEVYAELGRNLLHRGTYGWMDDGVVSPSLFRLPGYPIFMALLGNRMHLILAAQIGLDLLACVLLGRLVGAYVSRRAGLWTAALAATCCFTAVYAASAMTECLSTFAVAGSLWAMGRLLRRPDAFAGLRAWRGLLPLAGFAALAMLLRPDGALLTIAIFLALLWYGTRRANWRRAIAVATLFGGLACAPLVPWTIRNAAVFHVFQPLAPRHVNDPGERVNLGFYRWLRTWSVEFETTGTVYWRFGSDTIRLDDVSPRAFDSPAERAETAALVARYNQRKDVDQALDDAFGSLAARRIQANPLRYYVWLPALRVADMTFRPRVDATYIPAAPAQLEAAPWLAAAAIGLGLLNLFYVAAALAGIVRQRVPLFMFMATYVALRCLLLGTVENPEPRYTLEFYPIFLVCAGSWLGSWKEDQSARDGQSLPTVSVAA
jgi:hypothetical protein